MDSSIDLSLLQKEVLVSSDQSGQYWNVCIWDYNSGTNLQTYKNCGTVSHGLEFLRNDYMICAIYNKPYLNYFNLKGKTQQAKINTSSCVNCLAASSCGNYMALGIEDKVFLLEVFIHLRLANEFKDRLKIRLLFYKDSFRTRSHRYS